MSACALAIDVEESRAPAAIMRKRPSGPTSNARWDPGSKPPSKSGSVDSTCMPAAAALTLTDIIFNPLR